ncbi:right-handed parallel beta-helix repeat-containing protein [Pseudonocardia sp. RS010]|uniref:right-handed parallel beta-helix repeat-containing protein n=1 Tax=Pseudonocardia sp. RS010 TaxID=3385979 RepID=UPI0039A00E9B
MAGAVSARRMSLGAVVALLVLVVVSVLQWQQRPVPRAPVPPAGLTGAVGPVPRSCSGVSITTADDVQQAIDAHPPGTTFCLAAGTYRLESPVVPRDGDVLIGLQGATLSGSKPLTGWRRSGDVWSTTGFLPRAPSDAGECLDDAPTCTDAEDVFLDKQRLRRVTSLSQVTPGSVYADYGSNTLTIGDDPGAHLVEQAVAESLIRSTADDVTVANLVVEHAANPAQVGAIESRQILPYVAGVAGSGWRLLNNEVRLNHGVGVGVGSAATVTGNVIHHQGQLGFGAWGSDSSITDNEIAYNGEAGYSAEWEAGGGKSWMTENQTVAHNYVHDNMGPGLWSDGGNMDTVYEFNRVADNWHAGIQYEISYDAVIRYNDIIGNGRVHKGWAWDAGIQIQSSGGIRSIEIAQNTVTGNANGISLIDSGNRELEEPAPHGPHVVRNVRVHDNTVTLYRGQMTGAVEDTGNPGIFAANGNRFDNNTYFLSSLTEPQFRWAGSELDWSRWQTAWGRDLNGQAELVEDPRPRSSGG